MASRSPSSTPSEGEIVESNSEKATTSPRNINDNNFNPHCRHRVSASQSLSPIPSPKSYRSRTRSRSPYREPRGAKRRHEDDHYNDRPREDNRRFKVRYEDQPRGDRKNRQHAFDSNRSRRPEVRSDYDDRYDRIRNKSFRDRSPSPYSKHARMKHDRYGRKARDGRQGPSRRGYEKGPSRPSRDQSVSDRGIPPSATASFKQTAETRHDQKRTDVKQPTTQDQAPANASNEIKTGTEHEEPVADQPPVDEATLIEERRKRREAIKSKHRGLGTPLLVQTLAQNHLSTPSSPKPTNDDNQQPTVCQTKQASEAIAPPEDSLATNASPPSTPRDITGQESPKSFVVVDDKELANTNGASDDVVVHEDEPSAADYDPTMDMQEDRARQDNRQHEEVSSTAYDETKTVRQDVLLPEADAVHRPSEKPQDEFDMFADEDDMFADAPVVLKAQPEAAKAVPVPQSKAMDVSMLDDWDDHEGYYKVILGELLDGRYHVQSNLGRGMFSAVVRATDQKTGGFAAIKIIRNNESMKKAGLKEIEILQKLASADPEDKKHLVRLERVFEHKGHLCMVFENLSINLREVLKKFGRDVGINLKAVRVYAQQMFLGLSLLRKCNVLHADLKPDNVLVNESRNTLKICDLGSASDSSENEITPYLVSRFYRAPEIILGMPYDFGIDVWSVGCTLFELYTGKILFTGRNNNQMLRAIMECRGKFGHKILRKAEFARQHFDDLLNFRSVEKDKLTGKDVVRILNFTKPPRDLRSRLLANVKGMEEGEMKELAGFVDLLDKCLNLNPEKRCSPQEALRHPFITRVKG